MTDNELDEYVLDSIFTNIVDPIAICRVIDGKDGQSKDLIYVRINDAYEKINSMSREKLIGNRYSSVWAGDRHDWGGLMLQVAETGFVSQDKESNTASGFFEGESSVSPGFYQLFTFSPLPGWVVLIFRDMREWHKVATKLKRNEKLLRELTAKLTLAEEKTRRKIAMTLHDRIGYSMVSMLHTLRSLHDAQSEADNKKLTGEAIEEMEKLIQETRSFTLNISPPILYEVGLGAAIEARCENMQAKYGIGCAFIEKGIEPQLDEDTKILLYQMTHELLTNIIKHSEASNALVKIRWGVRKVQIMVEDNGIGFSEPERAAASGMGLFSIKERIKAIGGQIRVVSSPNKVTTVSIVAPIKI